jgi:hypothetical protein
MLDAVMVARLFRLFQLCIMLYVATAVLYTTRHLIFKLLPSCSPVNKGHSCTLPWLTWTHEAIFPPVAGDALARAGWTLGSHHEVYRDAPKNSDLHDSHSAVSSRTTIDEETLLSKAFSYAMRPSKIVPYYYRASDTIDFEDVTLATLITSNRFSVFAQLVERYQGLRPHLYCAARSSLWE